MVYKKVKTTKVSNNVLKKAKSKIADALQQGFEYDEAASFVQPDPRSTKSTRDELQLVINDFLNKCDDGVDPFEALEAF